MKRRTDYIVWFADAIRYLRGCGWRWPIVWYRTHLHGICWADRPIGHPRMPAPHNDNRRSP